jgi:hypothetical protein
MDFNDVLKDKVVYKLGVYKNFKAKLDEMIGRPFDEVVFAMDVGIDPRTPHSRDLSERDTRKLELIEFLRSKEKELSQAYGFPVSFLFLQGGPQVSSRGPRS